MATTTLNLPGFSLYHTASCRNFSATCSSPSFQIPKKRTQISCRKLRVSINPKEYGFFTPHPQFGPENAEAAEKKVMVANAAEVVAPTSDETASLPSKSSKKEKASKYPRRFLDVYQVLRNPVITEASIKNIAEENSLLFTVDVRADKKMIKEAVKNLFGVNVKKVNTSIRPDGSKKAFIMLSKEYNASDVAKSIGVFPGSD